MDMSIQEFKKEIWGYYKKSGRHNLAWRKTTDLYRVVVSEIMLQQTQVARVLVKYEEFLKAFPTLDSLAKSSVEQVLRVWQGMGYNRRAIYLKQIAEQIRDNNLPQTFEELIKLPGIGKNTAGSILAFAYNIPIVFMETNIRRVFIHFFFNNKTGVDDKEILALIEKTIDHENPREWYYALMDYGAMLGKEKENPNKKSKHYTVQSKFEGSNRQIRGAIVKLLLKKSLTKEEMVQALGFEREKIQKNLEDLMKEGFIEKMRINYQLKR